MSLLLAALQSSVDEREALTVIRDLQRAVAGDDRKAVAAMLHYPLTVQAGTIRIPIHDAEDLRLSYDAVFSPALKLVIASARLPARGAAPSRTPVEVTGQRVAIGGDAVTIEPVGGRLRITGIHVPLAASGRGQAAGRDGTARSTAPRRINLSFGRIEHKGILGRGEREVFLLSAKKNQTLDARITGVSGRDVVLYIANAKTRAAIDAKGQSGVRTWVGRIPQDGEYRIEIVRLAPNGAAQLPYTFVISLR